MPPRKNPAKASAKASAKNRPKQSPKGSPGKGDKASDKAAGNKKLTDSKSSSSKGSSSNSSKLLKKQGTNGSTSSGDLNVKDSKKGGKSSAAAANAANSKKAGNKPESSVSTTANLNSEEVIEIQPVRRKKRNLSQSEGGGGDENINNGGGGGDPESNPKRAKFANTNGDRDGLDFAHHDRARALSGGHESGAGSRGRSRFGSTASFGSAKDISEKGDKKGTISSKAGKEAKNQKGLQAKDKKQGEGRKKDPKESGNEKGKRKGSNPGGQKVGREEDESDNSEAEENGDEEELDSDVEELGSDLEDEEDLGSDDVGSEEEDSEDEGEETEQEDGDGDDDEVNGGNHESLSDDNFIDDADDDSNKMNESFQDVESDNIDSTIRSSNTEITSPSPGDSLGLGLHSSENGSPEGHGGRGRKMMKEKNKMKSEKHIVGESNDTLLDDHEIEIIREAEMNSVRQKGTGGKNGKGGKNGENNKDDGDGNSGNVSNVKTNDDGNAGKKNEKNGKKKGRKKKREDDFIVDDDDDDEDGMDWRAELGIRGPPGGGGKLGNGAKRRKTGSGKRNKKDSSNSEGGSKKKRSSNSNDPHAMDEDGEEEEDDDEGSYDPEEEDDSFDPDQEKAEHETDSADSDNDSDKADDKDRDKDSGESDRSDAEVVGGYFDSRIRRSRKQVQEQLEDEEEDDVFPVNALPPDEGSDEVEFEAVKGLQADEEEDGGEEEQGEDEEAEDDGGGLAGAKKKRRKKKVDLENQEITKVKRMKRQLKRDVSVEVYFNLPKGVCGDDSESEEDADKFNGNVDSLSKLGDLSSIPENNLAVNNRFGNTKLGENLHITQSAEALRQAAMRDVNNISHFNIKELLRKQHGTAYEEVEVEEELVNEHGEKISAGKPGPGASWGGPKKGGGGFGGGGDIANMARSQRLEEKVKDLEQRLHAQAVLSQGEQLFAKKNQKGGDNFYERDDEFIDDTDLLFLEEELEVGTSGPGRPPGRGGNAGGGGDDRGTAGGGGGRGGGRGNKSRAAKNNLKKTRSLQSPTGSDDENSLAVVGSKSASANNSANNSDDEGLGLVGVNNNNDDGNNANGNSNNPDANNPADDDFEDFNESDEELFHFKNEELQRFKICCGGDPYSDDEKKAVDYKEEIRSMRLVKIGDPPPIDALKKALDHQFPSLDLTKIRERLPMLIRSSSGEWRWEGNEGTKVPVPYIDETEDQKWAEWIFKLGRGEKRRFNRWEHFAVQWVQKGEVMQRKALHEVQNERLTSLCKLLCEEKIRKCLQQLIHEPDSYGLLKQLRGFEMLIQHLYQVWILEMRLSVAIQKKTMPNPKLSLGTHIKTKSKQFQEFHSCLVDIWMPKNSFLITWPMLQPIMPHKRAAIREADLSGPGGKGSALGGQTMGDSAASSYNAGNEVPVMLPCRIRCEFNEMEADLSEVIDLNTQSVSIRFGDQVVHCKSLDEAAKVSYAQAPPRDRTIASQERWRLALEIKNVGWHVWKISPQGNFGGYSLPATGTRLALMIVAARKANTRPFSNPSGEHPNIVKFDSLTLVHPYQTISDGSVAQVVDMRKRAAEAQAAKNLKAQNEALKAKNAAAAKAKAAGGSQGSSRAQSPGAKSEPNRSGGSTPMGPAAAVTQKVAQNLAAAASRTSQNSAGNQPGMQRSSTSSTPQQGQPGAQRQPQPSQPSAQNAQNQPTAATSSSSSNAAAASAAQKPPETKEYRKFHFRGKHVGILYDPEDSDVHKGRQSSDPQKREERLRLEKKHNGHEPHVALVEKIVGKTLTVRLLFDNTVLEGIESSRILELPRYAPGTHLEFRCPQMDGSDQAVIRVCEVSNVHQSPDPPAELSLPDGKIMRVPQPERYTALLATGRVVAQQQIQLFRPLSPRQKERHWAKSMSRIILDDHDRITQSGGKVVAAPRIFDTALVKNFYWEAFKNYQKSELARMPQIKSQPALMKQMLARWDSMTDQERARNGPPLAEVKAKLQSAKVNSAKLRQPPGQNPRGAGNNPNAHAARPSNTSQHPAHAHQGGRPSAPQHEGGRASAVPQPPPPAAASSQQAHSIRMGDSLDLVSGDRVVVLEAPRMDQHRRFVLKVRSIKSGFPPGERVIGMNEVRGQAGQASQAGQSSQASRHGAGGHGGSGSERSQSNQNQPYNQGSSSSQHSGGRYTGASGSGGRYSQPQSGGGHSGGDRYSSNPSSSNQGSSGQGRTRDRYGGMSNMSNMPSGSGGHGGGHSGPSGGSNSHSYGNNQQQSQAGSRDRYAGSDYARRDEWAGKGGKKW